jgi:C1A family cysteine protease
MFGFYVFNSLNQGKTSNGIVSPGYIPFPDNTVDKCVGGHACVIVGYNDSLEIRRYSTSNTSKTIGAFKILNSWGTTWGEKGYGWLPYEYVMQKYATDFWSILNMEWTPKADFGLGIK